MSKRPLDSTVVEDLSDEDGSPKRKAARMSSSQSDVIPMLQVISEDLSGLSAHMSALTDKFTQFLEVFTQFASHSREAFLARQQPAVVPNLNSISLSSREKGVAFEDVDVDPSMEVSEHQADAALTGTFKVLPDGVLHRITNAEADAVLGSSSTSASSSSSSSAAAPAVSTSSASASSSASPSLLLRTGRAAFLIEVSLFSKVEQSAIGAMFASRNTRLLMYDKRGRVQMERDPKPFSLLLCFLATFPKVPAHFTPADVQELRGEADFWQVPLSPSFWQPLIVLNARYSKENFQFGEDELSGMEKPEVVQKGRCGVNYFFHQDKVFYTGERGLFCFDSKANGWKTVTADLPAVASGQKGIGSQCYAFSLKDSIHYLVSSSKELVLYRWSGKNWIGHHYPGPTDFYALDLRMPEQVCVFQNRIYMAHRTLLCIDNNDLYTIDLRTVIGKEYFFIESLSTDEFGKRMFITVDFGVDLDPARADRLKEILVIEFKGSRSHTDHEFVSLPNMRVVSKECAKHHVLCFLDAVYLCVSLKESKKSMLYRLEGTTAWRLVHEIPDVVQSEWWGALQGKLYLFVNKKPKRTLIFDGDQVEDGPVRSDACDPSVLSSVRPYVRQWLSLAGQMPSKQGQQKTNATNNNREHDVDQLGFRF